TMDTAETLKEKEYSLGFEPQFIFTQAAGIDVVGHFDMGASDNSAFKFSLGGGTTGLELGGFYKMNFIPDFENQPAIGAFGEVIYTNTSGTSGIHLRIHPIASKNFK